MPAWALLGGGAAAAEWFTQRFIRARALLPAADFDTIVPAECADSITCELVDTTGLATASPAAFNGGAIAVQAGAGDDSTGGRGRLQLTGGVPHVGSLDGKSWYAASLVKMKRPPDEQLSATLADALGLWSDDNNRVGLGIFNGSGGSATNWVGYVADDASFDSALGPALDPESADVWHLFEIWYDVDAELLHFSVDGVEFDDTIAGASVPDVAATLAMILVRDPGTGGFVIGNYEKACVVVASPRVGEVD